MRYIWIPVAAGLAILSACAPAAEQPAPSPTGSAPSPAVAKPTTAVTPKPTTAAPADDLTYPVVFEDVQSLREVGLTLGGGWGGGYEVTDLPNKCYYYGDGGYTMTISDELLAGFRADGFSLRTACLGMISAIRFDPETGARLPTIMLIDANSLAQWGFTGEPGQVTEEIPLALPRCFRRGRPISDCALNFDMHTGQPMAPALRADLENAESRTLADILAARSSGGFANECKADQNSYEDRCRIETYPNTPDNVYIAGYLGRELIDSPWGINVVDISPAFEGGVAYAVFADGAAGPSASIESGKLALDKKKRASTSTIRALKIKLNK